MKVFISWSGRGSISQEVACFLNASLPRVLQAVETYMSSEDTSKGVVWFKEVSEELKNADYGIICATKENMESKWIHFELGALLNKFGTAYVAPLLINFPTEELRGPLSQLQATETNKSDLYQLLQDINKKFKRPLSKDDLKDLYETNFWPKFERLLNKIDEKQKNEPVERIPSERELLNEILSISRSNQNRMELQQKKISVLSDILESLSNKQIEIFKQLVNGIISKLEENKKTYHLNMQDFNNNLNDLRSMKKKYIDLVDSFWERSKKYESISNKFEDSLKQEKYKNNIFDEELTVIKTLMEKLKCEIINNRLIVEKFRNETESMKKIAAEIRENSKRQTDDNTENQAAIKMIIDELDEFPERILKTFTTILSRELDTEIRSNDDKVLPENIWMVRAGKAAKYVDEFEKRSIIAIGWNEIKTDLTMIKNKNQVTELVRSTYPDKSQGWMNITTGQISRFCFDIIPGCMVMTYNSANHYYLIGKVTTNLKYKPNIIDSCNHYRRVEWQHKVNRDKLSYITKNSLGSISTIFSVTSDAFDEITALLNGKK